MSICWKLFGLVAVLWTTAGCAFSVGGAASVTQLEGPRGEQAKGEAGETSYSVGFFPVFFLPLEFGANFTNVSTVLNEDEGAYQPRWTSHYETYEITAFLPLGEVRPYWRQRWSGGREQAFNGFVTDKGWTESRSYGREISRLALGVMLDTLVVPHIFQGVFVEVFRQTDKFTMFHYLRTEDPEESGPYGKQTMWGVGLGTYLWYFPRVTPKK